MRQIRAERVAYVRKHWRRYLKFAAFIAVPGGASMVFAPPLVRAYFAGVYTTMFISLFGYSLLLDGSVLRSMGAEAERWTTQELRKSDGWRVIDGVEFYDGDIDHVAVSAAQVLAVETKWTGKTVRIDERGVHGLWGDGVAQAARSAKRVANLLASKGIHQPVTPVLILWGSNVPEISGGYQRVGEVRVLNGRQVDEWRARLDRLPRWSHSTAGVAEVIEDYVRTYDQRRHPTWRARARAAVGLG